MTDTTISLSFSTRDRLKAMGKKGEDYDTLVNRLISVYKATQEGKDRT